MHHAGAETLVQPGAVGATPAGSPSPPAPAPSWRGVLRSTILVLSGVLLFRVLGAEPYRVPTGSMAPALIGDHKATRCPRCGFPVLVGRRSDTGDGRAAASCFASACCPNCGCADLKLNEVPDCSGDRLLVNKSLFELRRPHRWEMAIFRGNPDPARVFVKRVIGLPGESLQIRGGDVYVDGLLARKSLKEFKALRIAVFDNNYQPQPDGWRSRWLGRPDDGALVLEGTALGLHGTRHEQEHWFTYRHWALDDAREQPVCDTYGYNGRDGGQDGQQAVHDFMLECDVQVGAGTGWAGLAITDGLDHLTVEIPVGTPGTGVRLREDKGILRTGPGGWLAPGKSYHVELAFVDRRVTCTLDGRDLFEPLDLPAVEERPEVTRPAGVGVNGVDLVVHNFRLFRDIHYAEAGSNGVRTPVRLGVGEYFVLGDNSPSSDDSRFWPAPAVPEASFLGKPFLVHLPSRIVTTDGLGKHWEYQAIDFGRVRWLH